MSFSRLSLTTKGDSTCLSKVCNDESSLDSATIACNKHNNTLVLKTNSNYTAHDVHVCYKLSENVIKIWGDFGAIFGKKTMGYSTGILSDFWHFLKMATT